MMPWKGITPTVHYCVSSYDSEGADPATEQGAHLTVCPRYDCVGLFCTMTRGRSVGDWMIGRKGGNSSVLSHRGGEHLPH